ncbi:MAG TPA: translocation/assembly module TamB domain-containing protein [Candidatus Acidoferrales bacterium]|nr:translocation/assembly module TamB domain-containing protein [Candidatus Acidoferrales bacterium]
MIRKVGRALLALLIVVVVAGVTITVIVESGAAERWARGYIVKKIASSTGGRVELGAFHFWLFPLRAELDDFTLHGKESAALPPFFHADKIEVSVHVISFFHKKISLKNLEIDQPSVFVRVDENGHSNVPTPAVKRPPGKPWREQLFNLQIAQLKIADGTMIFNDAKIPVDAEGKDFEFVMNYESPTPGKEAYVAQLGWKQVEIAAKRYMPFRADVATKFTLTPNTLSVDDFELKLPNSTVNGRGEIKNFNALDVDFHCRAHLSLPDLRQVMRKPGVPDGEVDFTGNGTYAAAKLRMEGHYLAQGIRLKFQWFHAGGMQSWGNLTVANNRLTMPVFEAKALGGDLKGRLDMNFHGMEFRTATQMSGASLAEVLDATDNPSLPVDTLHWDGSMSVNTVTTWNRDFKNLKTKGVTTWSPSAKAAPGTLPVTAQLGFDYSMDRRDVILSPGSIISTPNSRLVVGGTLAAKHSALDADFHTARLEDWEDFIADLRGTTKESEPVTGAVDWKGELTGPLGGPTFAGAFEARDAHFGRLYWDDITGQMIYSPFQFQLSRAIVKRGHSTANLDLHLQLNGKWSFKQDDIWTLEARLDHASTDDLQGLFGTSYPASAVMTADFQGSGTRANPVLDGNFQLDKVTAYGIYADRAKGKLSLRHDEIRITDAELDRDTGRVSGDLLYRPSSREVEFQMAGEKIPLSKFAFLQKKAMPIGGELSFHLSGSGPLRDPHGAGTIQVTNLQFGSEVLDSFGGTVNSDGKTARLKLVSIKTAGKLGGELQLGLSGNYPISGQIKLNHIDLDPFIEAGLHLNELTGHSSVDGELSFSGEARQPDTIEMQAKLSRIGLDYEYVKLQNEGPVLLSYRKSEIHVDQATLKGADTNFQISGDAHFSGSRALDLRVAGSVNLRLVSALFPQLDARGVTQLNTTIAGTFSNPQITGQAKLIGVSAHYGDFPAGINNLNGEMVFDRSRLVFDNLTAAAGGGKITISGSVGYGEAPVRYEVNAVADSVRIRYPEGMSWLTSGTLRFSGTTNAALLSGSVTVQRITFAQNVSFSSLMGTTQTVITGPVTSSAYLRNLQFDVQADTGAGARIVWAGAHFTAEGGVHVRGTWEHPIVLGSVHLLTGEMAFHGNTYRLTRGDINFSDPFHFDPILNIEASTTINPYEITLDFSGKASNLQLAYRSDPPLPASDIISLLALGTPGQESGLMTSSSSQTQNFGATALLSEAISSQLGGPIAKLFGVTNFRVDPFLASSLATNGVEQSTAARVTIQKQVTRDLSVTYSTNANSNQQQVIEVDYSIRRDITIVALRDINGIFGINIKFTKHFN